MVYWNFPVKILKTLEIRVLSYVIMFFKAMMKCRNEIIFVKKKRLIIYFHIYIFSLCNNWVMPCNVI